MLRIDELKIELFDLIVKQKDLQTEITKIELTKAQKLQELDKLENPNKK